MSRDGVNDLKAELQKAWTESNFNKERQLAITGLRLQATIRTCCFTPARLPLATRQPKEREGSPGEVSGCLRYARRQ